MPLLLWRSMFVELVGQQIEMNIGEKQNLHKPLWPPGLTIETQVARQTCPHAACFAVCIAVSALIDLIQVILS